MNATFESVLLVEDEHALAETLKIALGRLKVSTLFHATTIDQAREILKKEKFELLILDRNLPDGDGLRLCEELRSESYQGLILCLTAKGEIDERVEGLESGADDYLPKPFHWEELAARIKALARRKDSALALKKSVSKKSESLWSLDETRLRVFGPKGWVELTPLEYKLATHLIQASGAIVSREVLLKEVWGFRFLPKTRTTDYFLGRLRKVFEINPDEPKHFLTVRGAGYRFSAEPFSDLKG